MAITQRLAQLDPANAGWQRDLSVIHISIGDVLRSQGDLNGALKAYRENMAITQRLAQSDPPTRAGE
jgi:predicted negative regulator of RcsB-dependent stress response